MKCLTSLSLSLSLFFTPVLQHELTQLWRFSVTRGFKSRTKDARRGAGGVDFDYEIDGIYIGRLAYEEPRNF